MVILDAHRRVELSKLLIRVRYRTSEKRRKEFGLVVDEFGHFRVAKERRYVFLIQDSVVEVGDELAHCRKSAKLIVQSLGHVFIPRLRCSGSFRLAALRADSQQSGDVGYCLRIEAGDERSSMS